MSELSKRIKKLLSERNLTVPALAKRCPISNAYLYRVINGKIDPKTMSLGKLEEIARALDVSLVKLIHDPGLKDIEILRQILSGDDLDLIKQFDTLEDDDWRRKAILDLLRINSGKDDNE